MWETSLARHRYSLVETSDSFRGNGANHAAKKEGIVANITIMKKTKYPK